MAPKISRKVPLWQYPPRSILAFVCVIGVLLYGWCVVAGQKIREADRYMGEQYPVPTAIVVGYAFGKWIT